MKLLVFAVGFLAAAGGSWLTAQIGTPEDRRVLRVTSGSDEDRSGTLRWAIQASNATPERETIELAFAGALAPQTPLPLIKGPVRIIGGAWSRTGVYSVIDGSGYVPPGGPESCAGATPGHYGANVRTTSLPGLQLIDTDDVEIAGVEIRRFCIGVLINRSTRVVVRDNRIVENRGGAGVMLTGDDGQGNATSTTTVNNTILRNEFVDNGDGLELTRGAAFNLVANNVFRSTAANPEPSQGIEILRGNDNVVTGNRFEGYSDGLQINWGDRNYIAANTFTGNAFGLNLTGIGNVIDGNVITRNRVGIAIRPAAPSPVVRLTRNRLSDNARDVRRCEAGGTCDTDAPRGAIVFGVPGLEHAGFVGSRGKGVMPATLQHICPQPAATCQPMPNGGLQPPRLTAARASNTEIRVSGSFTGTPDTRYIVELFGNAQADGAEAERFLGETAIYTDGRGVAAFTSSVAHQGTPVRAITASATSSADGATSPLSVARPVLGGRGNSSRP